MSKRVTVNIFKNMTEEEFREALNNKNNSIRVQVQLNALSLIAEGYSFTEVSRKLGMSYQTVARWARTCEKEGLKGLQQHIGRRRELYLTDEEKQEFKKHVLEHDTMTAYDLERIMEREFNIGFSITYVRQLMEELGFTYNKSEDIFTKK